MHNVTLAGLQREFCAALTASDNAVHTFICKDGNLNPSDRIEIYRKNVTSAHVSVLMSVYPVCEMILGSDYFKLVAKKYFRENPSCSADLNEYGDKFPDFLQQLTEQRTELTNFNYLADLAQLEWKIQEVYFSADNVELNMAELKNTCLKQGKDLSLFLQPGVDIVDSEYPIAELWEMHQRDNTEQVIDVDGEHEYLCIYRNVYQVLLKKIDADLFNLMAAIQEGKTLADIAGLFAESDKLTIALEKLIEYEWLRH